MTAGGNGSLNLWKYNYPAQRSTKDTDGELEGVAGTVSLLNNITIATQVRESIAYHQLTRCLADKLDRLERRQGNRIEQHARTIAHQILDGPVRDNRLRPDHTSRIRNQAQSRLME